MRWPIRNQILVPFALLQMGAIVVMSLFSVWLGIESAQQKVSARVDDVVRTIGSGTYPLSNYVLQQLRELSGAHLVLLDDEYRAQRATLPVDGIVFEQFSNAEAGKTDFEALPIVEIHGERFFAAVARRTMGQQSSGVVVLYAEAQWLGARSEAIIFPLAGGGIVLVLTLVVSIIIARRISKHVQELQQHVFRISQGDFEPVPHLAVDDELRDLSQDVNQMALTLKKSMQQIRENERMAMLAQLAGGLAHHLRNSLTGARVSIQLHQRTCSRPQDEALQVSLTQLNRTEDYIRSLLQVSQGKAIESCPSPLSVVLDDVAGLISPLCKHQEVKFSCHRDVTDILVQDAESVRGALLNVLTNAVEATGPGGQIELKAIQEGERVAVFIRDNGPEFSQETAENMFVPFFTTKQEGVGIGLSVARQTIEDSGGTLTVERRDGITEFKIQFRDHRRTGNSSDD